MFHRTCSALLSGLNGLIAEVECFIGGGLPYFNIVGIPGTNAAAARERIRSALKNCGCSLPPSRITVNIRPRCSSDQFLTGTYTPLDLPIALTILACQGIIPHTVLENALFLGELSLGGDIKPLSGALSLAHCALQNRLAKIYLPLANAEEAALSGHPAIFGLSTLQQTISVLQKHLNLFPAAPARPATASVPSHFDSIHGQAVAKRALTIAAAGMHNLLLIGPPGCGKTLLAQSLASLLPPLTFSEQVQLTEIYSCCHLLPEGQPLLLQRPFRAPHHTISATSLIGGGAIPHPGEITLAHHGILYLDELPEFTRASLESLRQPLEDHSIFLTRLHSSITFPADFLLVASMNPCPCGYYPDTRQCRCSASRIRQYFGKIDTPLLDRIDLILQLSPVSPYDLQTSSGLSFDEASSTIAKARLLQNQRFQTDAMYNSRMSFEQIQQFCPLSPDLTAFMNQAYTYYHLTMRSYHKILKVSRTLADLEGCPQILKRHLTEALQYRLTLKAPI